TWSTTASVGPPQDERKGRGSCGPSALADPPAMGRRHGFIPAPLWKLLAGGTGRGRLGHSRASAGRKDIDRQDLARHCARLSISRPTRQAVRMDVRRELEREARDASAALPSLSDELVERALLAASSLLVRNADSVLAANDDDVRAGEERLDSGALDR